MSNHWLALPGWATNATILQDLIPAGDSATSLNWNFFSNEDFPSLDDISLDEADCVIAYSMGTIAALSLEQLRSIKRLVLICPFASFCYANDGTLIKRKKLQVKAMLKNLQRDPLALLENFYREAGLEFCLEQDDFLNVDNLTKGLEILLNSNLHEKLASIQCPTLILYADNDLIVNKEQTAEILNSLTKASNHRFENAGHGLPQTHKAQCQELIKNFSARGGDS